MKRYDSIVKLSKWDNFRERKEKLIDEVIEIKKKQMRIKTFLLNTVICNLLENLKSNILAAEARHAIQMKTCFVCLKIKIKFKVNIRR